MATWLSQNDYVTDKGQSCINAVAAGNGRLAITAVYGSDTFYYGEHPNEATMNDPRILAGIKQQLGGVHCFPAPNSKTAYIVEAQLDTSSDRIAWDEAEQKFVATDSIDGYYLRQILVVATYIQYDADGKPYVDDGDENFLMMFAECLKEGDNPDTEKGGADSIPSKDTPRVLHTFAFRIDGFAYLNGELVVDIQNTTGAGVVTHNQLQNELARKYTNPNIAGHITHSPSNYTVSDKATKHLARPTKLIESYASGDVVVLPYASSTGTPPETSIFVPKTDDYTLNVLFAVDNVSDGFSPILELLHKETDTTVSVGDFNTASYDGATNSELYIASHTFKSLPEGWNTFRIKSTAPPDGDCGVVAVNLMSGTDYSFAYFSTTQSISELGVTDFDIITASIQNVDNKLGFFAPLAVEIDDYTTAGEVHNLTGDVDKLKTEADDLSAAVNEVHDELDELSGFTDDLDKKVKEHIEEYEKNGYRYRGKMATSAQAFNAMTKDAIGIWAIDKNSHSTIRSQLPVALTTNEIVLVLIDCDPEYAYCTQTVLYLKQKLEFKRYVQTVNTGNAIWTRTSEIFPTQSPVGVNTEKLDVWDEKYENKLVVIKKVTDSSESANAELLSADASTEAGVMGVIEANAVNKGVAEIVPTGIDINDVADTISDVQQNLSEKTTVSKDTTTLKGDEKDGTIQFVSHTWTKTVDSIESAVFAINEVGTINKAVGKWFDGTDITFNTAKLTVPALANDKQHYALCCQSVADDGKVTLILKVYTSETGITPLSLIDDDSLLLAPFKTDGSEQSYSAYGTTITNDDDGLLLDGVLIENSEIRSTKIGGGSTIDASETEFTHTTQLDAELEGSDS